MPTSLDCGALVAALIASGDLHAARFSVLNELVAVQHNAAVPRAEGTAFLNNIPAGKQQQQRGPRWNECNADWVQHVDALLASEDHLHKITRAHSKYYTGESTWACKGGVPKWSRECCSQVSSESSQEAPGCNDWLCCGIASAGDALELPLLHEPSLHLVWNTSTSVSTVRVEQDGFLRPYDMATVLWPAGYLLSLWVASLGVEQERWLWPTATTAACTLPEAETTTRPPAAPAHRRAIELGCGTGTASLAAAKSGRFSSVLATDAATRALALATANAALNGVDDIVQAQRLDWLADSSVEAIAAQHGTFDLVLGAALQFETWEARLWSVLRAITHPGSIVALAHTTGVVFGAHAFSSDEEGAVVEESGFHELKRISGLSFGFHTRWAQDVSDFEIVLFRRS